MQQTREVGKKTRVNRGRPEEDNGLNFVRRAVIDYELDICFGGAYLSAAGIHRTATITLDQNAQDF